MSGEWFRISSGEHEGRIHLAGWMHTAIKLVDDGSREYERRFGHMRLAICPRCSALVIADDKDAYGDRTWAHEQWHAATDYLIPTYLAAASSTPTGGET